MGGPPASPICRLGARGARGPARACVVAGGDGDRCAALRLAPPPRSAAAGLKDVSASNQHPRAICARLSADFDARRGGLSSHTPLALTAGAGEDVPRELGAASWCRRGRHDRRVRREHRRHRVLRHVDLERLQRLLMTRKMCLYCCKALAIEREPRGDKTSVGEKSKPAIRSHLYSQWHFEGCSYRPLVQRASRRSARAVWRARRPGARPARCMQAVIRGVCASMDPQRNVEGRWIGGDVRECVGAGMCLGPCACVAEVGRGVFADMARDGGAPRRLGSVHRSPSSALP
jgi:hypothetical protein